MTEQTNNNQLIDADIRLRFDDIYNPKSVTRKITQDIPQEFLDSIKDERLASSNAKMGNFHKVASIPTAVVEKWMQEGFNIFDKNVTVPEILKRLNSQHLDAFIATNRRIG